MDKEYWIHQARNYERKTEIARREDDLETVRSLVQLATECWRVVYHCNGEWDNFYEYTGALTNLRDLNFGWGMT